MVEKLPAMQVTLGQDYPLEKGIATHSSLLVWRIIRLEEPGGLYSPRCGKELDTTERLILSFYVHLAKGLKI